MSKKRMVMIYHYENPLEHGKVIGCGHRFDNHNHPRNNCESCWEAYFKVSADLPTLHDELIKNGKSGMEKRWGKKLVKQFDKFLTKELMKEKINGESIPSELQ